MIDRNKVIKGLECCMVTDDDITCADCPYNDPTTYEYGENWCLRERLMPDAIKLLKEQEAMSWINIKDELPNENGSYLVVYKAFQYALVDVKRFAKDLYSVDEYDFPNEHRPGWYEYDDEYGYIERNGITHWMPLPNLPEEDR